MHVGDEERARTTIDAAIAEAHTHGHVFGETLGTLSLASFLAAAGAPADDVDAARERALREARRLFAQIGATGWVRRLEETTPTPAA
jgi:hypothetical protein